MGLEIVHVTADTTDVLARIADDVFDYAIDKDHLERFCACEDALMFVAVDDGLVVGQVRGYVHRQPDTINQLYLDNLGVAPAFQRRGIATRLVKALLDLGATRGCKDVWLGTEANNDQARQFYRSLGLYESEIIMFANFRDDDA